MIGCLCSKTLSTVLLIVDQSPERAKRFRGFAAFVSLVPYEVTDRSRSSAGYIQ